MSENDKKTDGKKEIESNSEMPLEIEVDSANGEDEIDEQPNDESHQESKDSSSEVSKVLYENPDDSGYCDSNEPFTKLRKRPSNSILENTSKKARNNSKDNINAHNLNIIEENNNIPEPAGTVEKSNVSPETQSAFMFGCKHKIGESSKSGNNADGRNDSSGRFTKHKGDSKCQHEIPTDCDTTCSSEEADVEDNADDSDTTIDKSHETPEKMPQTSSPQKPPPRKITKIFKPHKLPPATDNSHKIVSKLSTVLAGTMIKNKKPFHSKNKDCISGMSSKGKNGIPSQEPKAKTDARKQKKRKCQICNKKLGLTAISCRCGGLFCSKHRYDKEHNCTFDYKAMGAEEIRKNNPKIVAEKVKKI